MKIDKDMRINGLDGAFPDGVLITEVTRDDANSILFSAIWHEICSIQSEPHSAEETKVSLDFVLEAYKLLIQNLK